MFFDGSDVGLAGPGDEDVRGLWVASNGDLYLVTEGDSFLVALQ